MAMQFDWEKAATMHRPEWMAWLKENHGRKVSEEEYVAQYRSLRENDPRPHKARRYQPSHIRQQYRDLVSKFGFFTGATV